MSKDSESDSPVTAFFEFFKERLGNPFFQAFSFCWLITNFKVLLVVFGEGGYEEKITYLGPEFWRQQACIFDDKSWCFLPGDPRLGSIVGIPLLLSFVYLIVVAASQTLTAAIHQFGVKSQNFARAVVDKWHDFASKEELSAFRRKFELEKSTWDAEIRRLAERNVELEDARRRLGSEADNRMLGWLERTLDREAASWGDDLVKITADPQDVPYRSQTAKEFLFRKGIPRNWAVTLTRLGFGGYVSDADFGRELNEPQNATYALEVMASLGIVQFDYSNVTRRIFIDARWQPWIDISLD